VARTAAAVGAADGLVHAGLTRHWSLLHLADLCMKASPAALMRVGGCQTIVAGCLAGSATAAAAAWFAGAVPGAGKTVSAAAPAAATGAAGLGGHHGCVSNCFAWAQ
jgi:hypothetical protein